MLSMSLYTGIDFCAAFKDEDVIELERDSHITIFYTDKEIPKDEVLDKIKTLDESVLFGKMKSDDLYDVLDFFELGKFENQDEDFVVLKLQEDNFLYPQVSILETGLVSAFDLKRNFDSYRPHVTLAKLEKGKAKNYMFSPVLNSILETAKFGIDDFVMSYGEPGEWKQYNLTSYNAVSRYFRQKELERDKKYYDSI